jgi:hypothetical protein
MAESSNYDFIFKDQPKPARRLFRPKLSNPLGLIAILVGLMIIIAIFGIVFGTKSKKVSGLTEVIGRAQEINRISAAEAAQLKDPATIAVSATVQNVLASDRAQIQKYASDHKIKIDKKKISSYQNKSTDDQLAKALSNNFLDAAYDTYLHDALTDYSNSLSSAYNATHDSGMKAILKGSYASTKVLLSNQPLKSSP